MPAIALQPNIDNCLDVFAIAKYASCKYKDDITYKNNKWYYKDKEIDARYGERKLSRYLSYDYKQRAEYWLREFNKDFVNTNALIRAMELFKVFNCLYHTRYVKSIVNTYKIIQVGAV